MVEPATYEQLLRALDSFDYEKVVIGHTLDERPLICMRLRGDKQPPILITAGAHADEPAGVFATLRLLGELDTEHVAYIVPCRDPLGWDGFRRYLCFALGTNVPLPDHDAVERVLHQAGEVVYQEGSFIVALVEGIGFASMSPAEGIGSDKIMRRLQELLKAQPRCVESLRGKRVILPANAPGCPGCEEFDRAYTTIITDSGRVANLNRLFNAVSAAPEVECLRALVDEIKPGLVLDCHEGFGDKFYLFTSLRDEPEWKRLAQSIVGAISSRGLPLSSLEELSAEMGAETMDMLVDLGDGIFAHRQSSELHDSLGAYCDQYGLSFTLESGMWNTLERRVDFEVWGVLTAISTFEALSEAGFCHKA